MSGGTPYDKVMLARAKGRATAAEYINRIFTDFIELHGDRHFADDKAVVGGVAYLAGMPVTVISMEKGKDTKSKVYRNFGAPNPEGYNKALRLMRQAEKCSRPVVCFVDTAGAFCGLGAEERGQGRAIAQNLAEMITLKTPIISIFIGEGGSGGALALACSDEVWMMENAIYSVISPEGCASILWKDSKKVKAAAQSLRLTAQDMQKLQVAEKVIPEKGSFDACCRTMAQDLRAAFDARRDIPKDELIRTRYERFRKYGAQIVPEDF